RAKLEHTNALLDAKMRFISNKEISQDDISAQKALLIGRLLDQWKDNIDEARSRWAAAPDVLRSPEGFYDPVRFVQAHQDLDDALDLYSASFFPAYVAQNNFATPHIEHDFQSMAAFCENVDGNPFYRFIESKADALFSSGAELIAFSVLDGTQMLPALTLTKALLKRRAQKSANGGSPDRPHLSIGGNYISRITQAITDHPKFFELFADSVSVGEGERALVALADALDANPVNLEALPNSLSTLYLGADGRVQTAPEAKPVPMGEVAFMDFSAFELERYYAPEVVVPIRASKGCYYGKCTFCDAYYGLHDDNLQIDRLVAEIRHLKENFGVQNFEFIDQAISPKRGKEICDAFIKADLDVRWFFNGRSENGFTRELLDCMKKAGATKIMWGLESGSQRLLDLMKKGVEAEGRLSILRDAAEVGLWNFGYIFFGFPTETEDEAVSTVDMIAQNTDIIHSYGKSFFTLGKHSPLMEHAEELGLTPKEEGSDEFSKDAAVNIRFGVQGETLKKISDRCSLEALEAYGGDPLWMYLRSRETLHLYLAHYGKEYLESYRLAQEEKIRQSLDSFIY
ncbi:radical SAM protein, partial [Myxococcota bacterium]|nr:radical SAM protein [Myxococcota bacterium]